MDLKAKKDTVEILKRLNRCYPFAERDGREGRPGAPRARQQARSSHEAKEALRAGDAERLGALMSEAQALFDRYAAPACPEELTRAGAAPGARARGPAAPRVGRQGRRLAGRRLGAVRGAGARRTSARSSRSSSATSASPCLPLTLGTGPKVRKAVIPAAGFGTRLFPATKAIKKELFPVVDRDGIAKPAILLIVEEALEAGIEEVVHHRPGGRPRGLPLVLQRRRSRSRTSTSCSRHYQDYARHILEIGRRVTFVTQNAQEGFGHAVYCAAPAVGDEPFLLMLGDHLSPSPGTRPSGPRCSGFRARAPSA